MPVICTSPSSSATVGFGAVCCAVIARTRCSLKASIRALIEGGATTVGAAAGFFFSTIFFDRTMGARPMARLIQQKIKEPLAEELLFGESLAAGGEVVVDVREEEIALDYPTA